MATRRNKSQARRSGRGQRGTPVWVWLLAGVALGLTISIVIVMRDRLADPTPRPQPNPDAEAPVGSEEPVAQQPRRPRYDFYTVLPERETVVPDAEISAQARAEERQAEERPTTPDLPAEPAPDGSRYVLQAGAFRSATDAEALRARIALSGLVARIEVAELDGDTLHRVRLGPYRNAGELEAAKRQLSGNGIESVAIRAR